MFGWGPTRSGSGFSAWIILLAVGLSSGAAGSGGLSAPSSDAGGPIEAIDAASVLPDQGTVAKTTSDAPPSSHLPATVSQLLASSLPVQGDSEEGQQAGDPLGLACVNTTGDAECSAAAVSLTGNATAHDGPVAISGTGDARSCDNLGIRSVLCIAASGSGNASGSHAASGTGNADGTSTAYSGTGNADSYGLGASGTGNASGYFAASGTGNASTCEGTGGLLPCTAVSGTGNSTGQVPLSLLGDCRSDDDETPQRCFDVEPTGNAHGYWAAVSVTGDATGPIPVSVLGDCRSSTANQHRACLNASVDRDATGYWAAASGTGDANGFILATSGSGDATGGTAAVSGLGDASATSVGVSGTGNASGCAAVSGTGSANGSCFLTWNRLVKLEASLCETVQDQTGSDVACLRLDPTSG